MKSKTQLYFEKMRDKDKCLDLEKQKCANETPYHFLHKLKVRQRPSFEERVYLENEALSKFCDFLEKE